MSRFFLKLRSETKLKCSENKWAFIFYSYFLKKNAKQQTSMLFQEKSKTNKQKKNKPF